MLRRLPIVAVFGQGSAIDAERAALAAQVGAMVARLDAHLLTGGGYGTMAAAAEGFVAVTPRAGLSIGIVPRRQDGAFDEPNRDPDGRAYPNSFIEIAIRTPLPPRVDDWRNVPARNHINVFTPDAIIALPGRAGTLNELDMSAFYRDKDARCSKERSVILVGPREAFADRHLALFLHATTVREAERHVRRILARRGFALTAEEDIERVSP
jgi:predicted Rossmann-fold nucleotide-binding protein